MKSVMRNRKRLVWAAIVSAAAATGASADAVQPAQVIKARQQGFKDLGAANKVVRDQLRGTPDLAKIRAASIQIGKTADVIHTWFPAGSGPEAGVKTGTRPEVWSKPAEFKTATNNFVREARKFANVAAGNDATAIAASFKALGQTCGGCHDHFRLKDE